MELDNTMSDMLAELIIRKHCSTSGHSASFESREPSPFGFVESVRRDYVGESPRTANATYLEVRRTYFVEALTLGHGSESEVRRVGECITLKDAIKAAQQVIDESLTTWNYDGTTVEKLFTRYERFGERPFIFADSDNTINVIGFNALIYAMKQCELRCAGCQSEPALNAAF